MEGLFTGDASHLAEVASWIAAGPSHSIIIVRQRVAFISAHASVAKYPAGSRDQDKQPNKSKSSPHKVWRLVYTNS